MTMSYWSRPHTYKSPDLSTDVLIIGGGYVGLSTAYWLTEMRPDLKVMVLERQEVGAGASGRNAGFLTKGSSAFYRTLCKEWGPGKALSLYRFAEESLQLVHERILKASPEIKYEKTASLTLFEDASLFGEWRREGFEPASFNFQWVEGKELPGTLGKTFVGGHENSPEYKINPLQLLNSLKTKLESRKVQVIEGLSAFRLTPEGVLTETNSIKAKQVVLAMNGYLPQFHPGFQDFITPHRAQMLAVELKFPFDCPALHYDPAHRVYWRKTQDNLLVIGGKRLLDGPGERGDFDRLSPLIQGALEDYLRERLGLDFKIIQRWSGIMGFTGHELPFVTRVEAPLEAFMIGGFSGHGMGLGFHSAREMAELVSGKKDNSYFSQFKQIKIVL